MTASSIAQYLEQRRSARPLERAAPKDPWAALTSRAVVDEPVNSDKVAFRPLTFKSAEPAPRASGNGGGHATSDAMGPRPHSALLRPREAPPPPPPADIEERLVEAYHRGVQEGLDAARGEAATSRALERAEGQKRSVIDRLDFQMNEYAKLTEAISQGLREIEARIAETVARTLRPFLLVSVTSRAVEDLAAHIAKLSSSGHPPLLKICGPEPLLKLLKERAGDLAVKIEFTPNGHIEVKVEASHTTISTELSPWIELIQTLSESADG